MILNTTTDLKQYIAIAQSFEYDDFKPYITKAVNKFTVRYVGNLHETLADESLPDSENSNIKNTAREYLRSAIANFAWFLYLPLAQVQMDSSGISVATNENRATPQWWQIKDIRRELLQSGHEAMDLLLKFLEQNPEVFTDYAENFSTINKELIVNNAEIFSKYYNISESRQTYLALQPTIRLVEDQYLHTFLCPELIAALKTAASGNVLAVKKAIQKSMVAFTVTKVANIGLFILDDKGLRLDFETMIDGRRENPTYGKTADQLEKLATEQINNGSQYLQLAKQIIEENPSDFDQCDFPLIQLSGKITPYKSHDTKGVFGL